MTKNHREELQRIRILEDIPLEKELSEEEEEYILIKMRHMHIAARKMHIKQMILIVEEIANFYHDRIYPPALTVHSHVGELHISVEVRNALENANISTIGKLLRTSGIELMNIRNLSKKRVNDIYTALLDAGFSHKKTDKAIVEKRNFR